MKKKEYRYRIQHACFDCRKVFKIDYETAIQARRVWLSRRISGKDPAEPFHEPVHHCAQCSRALDLVGRAFRAPKMSDIDAWEAAHLLFLAGYRFYSSVGCLPTNSNEARRYIEQNRKTTTGQKLAIRIARDGLKR